MNVAMRPFFSLVFREDFALALFEQNGQVVVFERVVVNVCFGEK